MRPKVIYILGAGFSAPLGLPLMSNFLIKSKDLFFGDPGRYGHFVEVFDSIERMSIVKNFFDADMFNIEEILSVLEMQSFVEGNAFSESFNRYICDTIAALTPPMRPYAPLPGNWYDFVYGKDSVWRQYGHFFGAMCGLDFTRTHVPGKGEVVACKQVPPEDADYSVITLNYDRVVENVADFVTSEYETSGLIGFRRPPRESDDPRPLLAKLHGSVEVGSIVPPTWSKGSHSHILPEWSEALRALRDANYIRMIGYSLPVNDAYVRYLLKAATVGSKHLKQIDVLNLDERGDVRARYDSFITFNYYRFANVSTEQYLGHVHSVLGSKRGKRSLESAHEEFMRQHAA